MKHPLFHCVTIFLLLGLAVGCGGRRPIKTDYVEGTVTYKGAPVASASLSFTPVEKGVGNPAYGMTDETGRYQIQTFLGAPGKGTTPGEYIVTVSKSEPVPPAKIVTDLEGKQHETYDKYRLLVPEIYTSSVTSHLRATVTSGGPNVFDFELQDKAQ